MVSYALALYRVKFYGGDVWASSSGETMTQKRSLFNPVLLVYRVFFS
jgi:hypothetical protein